MAQCALVLQGLYLLSSELPREEVARYRALFTEAAIAWHSSVAPGQTITIRGELLVWRRKRIRSRASIHTESGEQGRSGIRFDPRLAELNFTCQVAGIPAVEDTAIGMAFTAEQRRAMNSCMLFAGMAAIECWKDAGFNCPSQNPEVQWDCGAIFGNGIGGMDTIAAQVVPLANSGNLRRLGSTAAEQVMASYVSALIGGLFGLGNNVTTNSAACATGTEAVVAAFRYIRAGGAARMIAGSAEGYSLYTSACFDAMRVTSRGWNAAPDRASRPLSASAAGALLLENRDAAIRRGARIYAEVLGAHVNCGGQRGGGSITASNPEGAQRCIREALTDARIQPGEITYVNGHLTATRADVSEINNLSCALGRDLPSLPLINSTKSMIGHGLGAAGSMECVATVLQLYHSFVHPSLNCEDLHPDLLPAASKIPRSFAPANLPFALKTSFGFGDVNACVVFGRYA
jgi:3-oxoacyl-(acyl-carrier-protein) synthase